MIRENKTKINRDKDKDADKNNEERQGLGPCPSLVHPGVQSYGWIKGSSAIPTVTFRAGPCLGLRTARAGVRSTAGASEAQEEWCKEGGDARLLLVVS